MPTTKYGHFSPVPGDSLYTAITTTEADFATMTAGQTYLFTCNQDAWIKQGAAPVAAAKEAGSMFVAKGVPILIIAEAGALIMSVMADTTSGNATLQKVLCHR